MHGVRGERPFLWSTGITERPVIIWKCAASVREPGLTRELANCLIKDLGLAFLVSLSIPSEPWLLVPVGEAGRKERGKEGLLGVEVLAPDKYSRFGLS